jgi:predicted transcriptional regulator
MVEQGEKEVRAIVQAAISEYIRSERERGEPAQLAELREERRKREALESRLNALAEENRRAREIAEESERGAAIRAELQRLGVAKLELAYKAVKDEIRRTADGRLVAGGADREVGLREYLADFVNENPELLPARIAGGSGASGSGRLPGGGVAVDLDRIKPGMDPEELERVRQEITRVAMETLRGR